MSESSDTESFSSTIRDLTTTCQVEIDYLKSTYLDTGFCVFSPKFRAGGYQWSLEYYPQGYDEPDQNHEPSHASLYLFLESSGVKETKETSVEFSFHILNKKREFITIGNPKTCTFSSKYNLLGEEKFIARDTIEKLYCMNGVLVISCSIRFLVNLSPSIEPIVARTYLGGLSEHIEKLWEKGESFDLTFEVEGQIISAHRFMLAARSPVFKAQLYGSMAEAKMEHIKINEMKAEVFKALLNFIYTDQLATARSSDHITLSVELLQDLLVAADRYALEKLTLLCDEELEMNLSVETVMTTLLLADRHNRTKLKKECLDFASRPKNFMLVALTEGYLNIMPGAPALRAELCEKIKLSSNCVKRRRTDW